MKCAECLCVPQYCKTVSNSTFGYFVQMAMNVVVFLFTGDLAKTRKNILQKMQTWQLKMMIAVWKELATIMYNLIKMIPYENLPVFFNSSKMSKDSMLLHLGWRYFASLQQKLGKIWACSVFGQNAQKGFIINLQSTFKNFVEGCKKITKLHKQNNIKSILKSHLYILVTPESACILTAETVGIVFYQYSTFLSAPLALLVGVFTVVVSQAYKMNKSKL